MSEHRTNLFDNFFSVLGEDEPALAQMGHLDRGDGLGEMPIRHPRTRRQKNAQNARRSNAREITRFRAAARRGDGSEESEDVTGDEQKKGSRPPDEGNDTGGEFFVELPGVDSTQKLESEERVEGPQQKNHEKHVECTRCDGVFVCDETDPRTHCVHRDLKKKAMQVLRHLKYLGFRQRSVLLPISCLTFRQDIQRCFSNLTEVQKLTIKTCSKVVEHACEPCEKIIQLSVRPWKKERFQDTEVNTAHLELFKKAFKMNVPYHWNKREMAYVPNGHSTLNNMRAEGGNWNEEEFADYCRAEAILSNGKKRIVTMYSAHNTEILTPLHQSLYSSIRRYGWLLVGSPSDEQVNGLNGPGEYLSYDYASATDNIKREYVSAAVEELKRKAVGLTAEEIRSLDVVSNLKFAPRCHVAQRGQPMGSLMSFPLLCLINKTVVDLTLQTLKIQKKISFKEWLNHRCLINGDDLLTKSPTVDSSEYDLLHRYHGSQVGLVVNVEKTMKDEFKCEINSTLFSREEKKFKNENEKKFENEFLVTDEDKKKFKIEKTKKRKSKSPLYDGRHAGRASGCLGRDIVKTFLLPYCQG
uniref:Putative RdRp n=1 Tax=Monilinia ourmiavirus I TaxID=2592717 RepID=A0A7G3W8V6_9VIRU|nr:putative RdRp [Monilinia ourmiavirus I]